MAFNDNSTPVEIGVIADVFTNEIARVEKIGPCVRLVFVVPQTDHRGASERLVVARLIVPQEARVAMAHALLDDNTGADIIPLRALASFN